MGGRRDYWVLMTARVVRAFGFGYSAVLVGIHLQARGLSAPQIGLVLSVGLAAASLTGLASAAATARIGRRMTLSLIGILMALCGLDLAFATSPWLLVLAGVTGMMGIASTDLGPFLAVEQAVLAQAADPSTRNRAFARYSLTGGLAGAAGGFAAALGTSLHRTELFFMVFAGLGVVTALLPVLLSPDVEGNREEPVFGNFRPLIGLSALFALDSLGNGLVVNAVIAYWLHVKFSVSPAVLGPSFAVMSLLGAFSFELSGRLADRIGLVNTMVFTHLPSNLLLMLIPFAPAFPVALGILLVRALVVQMDQPARQAYVVSIVKPSERSGALAITGAVRGVANGVGPVVTGAAIQAASLGIPFYIGGTLKTLYDIGLYFGFRRRMGDHEELRRPAAGATPGGPGTR
ncbi:MAG TPA: MFS transporter [Candidatus Dormibacteraeota bacterium]